MANRTVKRIVSLRQLAKLLHPDEPFSERWINRLNKEHGLPKVGRGKYDIIACFQWYVKYLRERADSARRESESLQKSEERKNQYQADLLELKLSQLRGEVIDIATVLRFLGPELLAIRSILLGIPKQAIRELGPDAGKYLHTLIEKALNDLAGIPDRVDSAAKFSTGHGADIPGDEAPAKADGKPVGGPVQDAQSGNKRRKRPVADKQGGVPT